MMNKCPVKHINLNIQAFLFNVKIEVKINSPQSFTLKTTQLLTNQLFFYLQFRYNKYFF